MAICDVCNREMMTADGCSQAEYDDYPGRGPVARIRWGEGNSVERFGPDTADNRCGRCGYTLGSNLYHPDAKREECPEEGCYYARQVPGQQGARLAQADVRCGDCGAKWGHYHHPGCDLEECPVCHGQAISCDCASTAQDED